MSTTQPNPAATPARSPRLASAEPPPLAPSLCSQPPGIGERDRRFGIELALGGPGVCTLCEQPGSAPLAGFFALDAHDRVRLCDVCLFEASAPLGLVLAAVGFLRKVGRLRSAQQRHQMAAEIADFAHVFETMLARRFGPAEPSKLLEHFAVVGRLAPGRQPLTS